MRFEIDEAKLRSAIEPNDLWLETWYGRTFLGMGYAALTAIGTVLLAGLALLVIASPDFRIGVAIFVALTVIPGFLAALFSGRR